MALSDPELREWLENLAPTNEERKAIIIDLLRHKGEDHMSGDDAADCGKALKWLASEDIPERPGPKSIAPVLVEVEMEH